MYRSQCVVPHVRTFHEQLFLLAGAFGDNWKMTQRFNCPYNIDISPTQKANISKF